MNVERAVKVNEKCYKSSAKKLMTEITHLTSIHLSFIQRLRFLLKMLKKHNKMKQKCNVVDARLVY